MMKSLAVIWMFCLFFLSIQERGFSQTQNFDVHLKGLKSDTVFNPNKTIKEIRATKMEDSLLCSYLYYESGNIKSKKIYITTGRYNVFLYCHQYEFYETGTLQQDSLVDHRLNNNKIEKVINYFPNGKIENESTSKGKRVKGRGIGETFSWGTTWTTNCKAYNEFGEVVYEEKSTRYHR